MSEQKKVSNLDSMGLMEMVRNDWKEEQFVFNYLRGHA
jgi:hypothetical protein